MAGLRELLADAGYGDVRTYVQSGNVVTSTRRSAERAARDCEQLIRASLRLDIAVLARTAAQLEAVVRHDPLGAVVTDRKRYLVTFLETRPAAATVKRLEERRADAERLAVNGREVYSWHPVGAARSKLAAALASPRLGVKATSRNWTTVNKLLEMASS
jgi:uncharacterized protein (DUF1697 family)